MIYYDHIILKRLVKKYGLAKHFIVDDKVKIRVKSVDLERKSIDYELVAEK